MIEALLRRTHPQLDDERSKARDNRRTVLVEDDENDRARRNQCAAYAQDGAYAKAPEAADADRRADGPSQHHGGQGETADQR